MNEQGLNPVSEAARKPAHSPLTAGSNARETAYQIIRDKIIRLQFRPGEPLSDKLLADELDMSRTPVREALILLAAHNMVILRPQIGTFVAPIDTERMEMEQFARFALEKEVMTQAYTRLTAEHHWQYSENLRVYRHYAAAEHPDRASLLLSLDNDFHRIAFTAVGKERNFELMLQSLHHVERMRMLSLAGLNVQETGDDHALIYAALKAGDLPAALAALEVHLNRYKANLPFLQEKFPAYFSLGK